MTIKVLFLSLIGAQFHHAKSRNRPRPNIENPPKIFPQLEFYFILVFQKPCILQWWNSQFPPGFPFADSRKDGRKLGKLSLGFCPECKTSVKKIWHFLGGFGIIWIKGNGQHHLAAAGWNRPPMWVGTESGKRNLSAKKRYTILWKWKGD